MLRVLLFTFTIPWAGAENQLWCKSGPFPTGGKPCPPNFTELPNGLCCFDDDVYTTLRQPHDAPFAQRNPKCFGHCETYTNHTKKCLLPVISGNGTTLSSSTSTTSDPCHDKINNATGVSDCPMRSNLCTDPNYRKVMHDQCPKTCGFCTTGSTTKAPACSDKVDPRTGVSDCPQKKYLCTDPTYEALMKDKCPKTCGYC